MDTPSADDSGKRWFAVRCFFRWPEGTVPVGVFDPGQQYEERVTIWRAADFDEALALASAEAERYSTEAKVEPLDYRVAYIWDDELEPGHGAEVFSLNRTSDLEPADYFETFITRGTSDEGLFADGVN